MAAEKDKGELKLDDGSRVAGKFKFKEIGPRLLRGRSTVVMVYEVLDD